MATSDKDDRGRQPETSGEVGAEDLKWDELVAIGKICGCNDKLCRYCTAHKIQMVQDINKRLRELIN